MPSRFNEKIIRILILEKAQFLKKQTQNQLKKLKHFQSNLTKYQIKSSLLNYFNPFDMYLNNNLNEILNVANKKWPYLEAKDYNSFNSIAQTFPHLKSINLEKKTDSQNKIGLIIRSANDDNVHKAIKYGIWTTTPKNKNKLQQLWQRHLKDQTEIYLFFSVVKSGMFEGVARLSSAYYEESFPFWWQNHSLKFKGFFLIQWIYIKDINYKHFEDLYNIENEEVTKSKDCDILNHQTTNQMLQIYKKRPLKRYIFNDFDRMDDREKNYTRKMYQYVLSQQQRQQFYANFNYNTNVHQMHSNNQQVFPQNKNRPPLKIQPKIPPMIPMTAQMMIPQNIDPNSLNGMNLLGFQMNPVSKNRKK